MLFGFSAVPNLAEMKKDMLYDYETMIWPNLFQLSAVGAFVCGLSLCNQHTMVVYVFLAGSWVLYELQVGGCKSAHFCSDFHSAAAKKIFFQVGQTGYIS